MTSIDTYSYLPKMHSNSEHLPATPHTEIVDRLSNDALLMLLNSINKGEFKSNSDKDNNHKIILDTIKKIFKFLYKNNPLTNSSDQEFTLRVLNHKLDLIWLEAFKKDRDENEFDNLLSQLPNSRGNIRDNISNIINELRPENNNKLKNIPPNSGVYSLESPGHGNQDVFGARSFKRKDKGQSGRRYVLGDGSGGSFGEESTPVPQQKQDQLIVKKMEEIKESILSSLQKTPSQAIINADKDVSTKPINNPAYGTIIAADVLWNDKTGNLERIDIASVGDVTSIGWSKNGYNHRRSKSYGDTKKRGEASQFQLLTYQDNMAQLLHGVDANGPKTHLLDIATAANTIIKSVGNTPLNEKGHFDANLHVEATPRTYSIDTKVGDQTPDILILCSDGMRPNQIIAGNNDLSTHLDKYLTNYTDNGEPPTLSQISERITDESRQIWQDDDDITIFLIDLNRE